MRSDSRSVSEAFYHSSSMIASSNPLFSCCTLRVFRWTTLFRVSFDSFIHQSLLYFPFSTTYPESIFLLVATLFVIHFVFRTLCFSAPDTIIHHCRSQFNNGHQKSSITLSTLSRLVGLGSGHQKSRQKTVLVTRLMYEKRSCEVKGRANYST